MKTIWVFGLVLTLIIFVSFSAIASPMSVDFDRVLLYGAYNGYGSGTIEEARMDSYKGFGIGFLIPFSFQAANVGLEFSSKDYDDPYYEIQATMLLRDTYLMRLNYFNYGNDGEIVHFGAYNYQDYDQYLAYFGGGLSMVCFDSDQDPDKWAYFSLYLEVQGQLRLNENTFLFAGVLYDYHLSSTSFEVGIGSNL